MASARFPDVNVDRDIDDVPTNRLTAGPSISADLELWAVCAIQRRPRRPLRRVARRQLPSGARRARRRVFHPGRVEGCSPAAIDVAGELEVVALVRHAECDAADASVHREWSARQSVIKKGTPT